VSAGPNCGINLAAIASERDCLRLYRTTKEDNTTARSLYDQIRVRQGIRRLMVDRFLNTAMYYQDNYGLVPHTLAEDGIPSTC
jgi:inorganic pyrophosphatase